jgi:hypothetical protein
MSRFESKESYTPQKSSSALYSANSRYKQKLLTGKAPTANELEAHLILEQKRASPSSPRGNSAVTSVRDSPSYSNPYLSKTSPTNSPAMNLNISPISYMSSSSNSPSTPSRGRAKSPVRSPRTLSPEAKAKAIINVTNARYAKKIKNGQLPTAEELEAHQIVEANKVNSPRVLSPRSSLTPEQKKHNSAIYMANARYARKIKNGQVPTAEETEAFNIVQESKAGNNMPQNKVVSSVLSPKSRKALIL